MLPPAARLPVAGPVVVLALVLALVLGGCADEAAPPEPALHTAGNGDVFNDADAAFAADLVQHHALALRLVDLTRGAGVSPELSALAEEVLATESLEIETVTDWLVAWDRTVPETIRDHANAGHGDHDAAAPEEIPGGDLPGMPSPEDLAALTELRGAAFEQQWVELMVTHHEGAIEIAEEEIDDGTYAPAVDLARTVADTQRDQVDELNSLLGG